MCPSSVSLEGVPVTHSVPNWVAAYIETLPSNPVDDMELAVNHPMVEPLCLIGKTNVLTAIPLTESDGSHARGRQSERREPSGLSSRASAKPSGAATKRYAFSGAIGRRSNRIDATAERGRMGS